MSHLLNVNTAIEQILSGIETLSFDTVDLPNTLSRVLAEDIFSDISLPPFANSSMDGYAVRAEDIATASKSSPVSLHVTMDIPAGFAPNKRIEAGEAARIMTGAPLPDGADCIIPVEDTDGKWYNDATAVLEPQVSIFRSGKIGESVRPIGEDIQNGQQILRKGTTIGAAEIGILAALGSVKVPVIRQPCVAILSTGNELVDINQPLSAGKIRNTNSYTLEALLTDFGAQAIRLPIAPDTLDDVRALFQNALSQKPDLIISSAGVSVGAADLVRTVLDELGKIDLWRINLRPGKPLAFGYLQGIPFFGLPGNPVSAMVTFEIIVRPALAKLSGKPHNPILASAILEEDLRSDGRRSYIRVKLRRENGHLYARTTGTQSSGALMSMVLADALLIVPEDVTEVASGTEMQIHLLREV